MSIELPPLYGTAHGYACEAVEARERILMARIAELEADAVAKTTAWGDYVADFVGEAAMRELRKRFDAGNVGANP